MEQVGSLPRKGYKSITVREEVYNFFKEEYEKKKDELRLKGIPSFSAFCTKLLYELIQREKVGTRR